MIRKHHELECRCQRCASISELYEQLAARRAARERIARLVCCGLLPALLALAVHLAW